MKLARIDWNEKASIVHSKIRALYNAPGAYTNFNGKRIKIHKSKIHLDQVSAYPGSFTIKNDSLFVSCSDLQLENFVTSTGRKENNECI